MIGSQSVVLSIASAASLWALATTPPHTESQQGGDQQAPTATEASTAGPEVTIRVARSDQAIVFEAGEHDIVTMLEAGARALSHHYVFPASELAAIKSRAVELAQPLRLPRNRIKFALFRLAAGRGLAPLPIDAELDLYEWIFMGGPRRKELNLRALKIEHTALDPLEHTGLYVHTRVPIQHLQVNAVQNSLRPFLMNSNGHNQVSLGSFGKSIVIAGPGDLVHRIVESICAEDQRGKPQAEELEQWQADIAIRLRQLELEARTRTAGSRR